MAAKPPAEARTFRHGNLPEALVDAALERLEPRRRGNQPARPPRDAGVNHRAVTGTFRTSWRCWHWSPNGAGGHWRSAQEGNRGPKHPASRRWSPPASVFSSSRANSHLFHF